MFPMKHKEEIRPATIDEVRALLRHDPEWDTTVFRFLDTYEEGDTLQFQQARGITRYVGERGSFHYLLTVSVMMT